jgi:hypothetical protein
MKVEIIGVYPVEAAEPCHLVEVWIRELDGEINVEQFTQDVPGQPKANWQAPYDERILNEAGTDQVGDRFLSKIAGKGDLRLVFFFHDLDLSKPLLSPAGSIKLPAWSNRPERLDFLEYEEP